MCKKILIIFFPLLSVSINAQWIVQQAPTTNTLRDVFFADSSEGWISGYDGIFHTINGGTTWEIQYSGLSGVLSGLSVDEIWATGDRGKILHTTNSGKYWNEITLTQFTDLDSLIALNNLYFYDTNIGWTLVSGWQSGIILTRLLKTIDGGISWQMMVNPLGGAIDAMVQFFDTTDGLLTSSAKPVFRTTNGGESWDSLSFIGYMVTFDMQFITRNIGWLSTDGPVLITAVWKTDNGGSNWFNNLTLSCSDLRTYMSFVDTLKGWVVTWTCITGGTEIWHTSDGGTSWVLQFTYSPPFYFRPWRIFFVDSLHGWIVGENGIILHTSTGGIIPVELLSFTADVTDDGVKLKWATATETNNQGFEILRFTQNDNEEETIGFVQGFGTTTEPKSYSFTDKNVPYGTYKYQLKQIDFDGTFNYSEVIEVETDFRTKEFVLYQNYPNPFNPTTKIKYTIPNIELHNNASLQIVTLKVFDVLGNEVATLVNEEKQPGVYEVEIDASNLTSGVYLYRMISASYSETKKMILLR